MNFFTLALIAISITQTLVMSFGTIVTFFSTRQIMRDQFSLQSEYEAKHIGMEYGQKICRMSDVPPQEVLKQLLNESQLSYLNAAFDNGQIVFAGPEEFSQSRSSLVERQGFLQSRGVFATFGDIPSCGDQSQSVGVLEVGMNYASIESTERSLVKRQLLVLLGQVLLLFLGLGLLSGRVRRTVSQVVARCTRIAKGDFTVEDHQVRDGQFKVILDTLNKMCESLTQLQKDREEVMIKSASQSKMTVLGEMAAGIAHEINNPMAIIKGHVQLLSLDTKRGQVSPEKVVTILEKIDHTVDRVVKIIRGLKTFTRDGSKDPYKPENVSTLIEDTLSMCQQKIRNAEIELRVQLDPQAGAIECRSTQIEQVLLNLISNAMDAVESLPQKWIRIETRASDSDVEIRIIDSGAGIPAPIREKILQPFFTTKPPGKGTGLGLSISFGIIKDHLGHIDIDAQAPNTTFVIRLPKKRTQQSVA